MPLQVLGIYSRASESQLGMGGSSRESSGRTYWYVRLLPDDSYEVRPLNANHLPAGFVKSIGKREFIEAYTPELDYYEKKTVPALQSLTRKIERGHAEFARGDLDAAEREFLKALQLDETSVEANLGLADVAQAKGSYETIKTVVGRLMGTDLIFLEEQRHNFNQFAITLRKLKLFEEALGFYSRAAALAPDDEHLQFNLARLHFESGDLRTCRDHLYAAVDLNPEFIEARRFLEWLDKNGRDAAKPADTDSTP